MLEENNSIIIVDDLPDDVNRITNIFNEHGIGCRGFVYDSVELIDEPLKNVKLAFFDICLSTTGNDIEQFTILYEAIKSYISCENRDFVLVFWTSKPQMIEDFKKYINEREILDMPKPIAIKAIDKHQFIGHADRLQQTLSDLMEDPIVRCLFSFESELKSAANQCLRDVLQLIEFPDAWGDTAQYIENIKRVFAMIAIETLGKKRGSELPDLAIKEAFAPLFAHYLFESESCVWKQLFEGVNITKIKNFPNPAIVASLNTLFHLDFTTTKEIDSRGSVRKIERGNVELAKLFEEQIGYNLNEWIYSVLLKKYKIEHDVLDLVALEYSAACDYSNAKKRTHRYILGVILPIDVALQLDNEGVKLGDAVYELPFKFMYRGQECTIFLHFNFSINEEESSSNKILGERLFSLKSEVMNMICDSHARHISRIGITSFR